jgi:uncharacterized SAM-binding protein YcdF (DUF218 family)
VYVYLSKLLPPLIMPLNLVFIALLLAVFWLGKKQIGKARLSLLFSIVLLWFAASPFVAASLYGALEQRYPARSLSEVPAAECAVLLGGAIATSRPPQFDIEFGEAYDRLYRAAEIYRTGKARTIIVAAGNQPWATYGPAEGEIIAELLRKLGVPENALAVDSASRNTRENAINSEPLLKLANCEKPLLITSAAHMPRALAAFSALGIEAIPVSTDVRVIEQGKFSSAYLIPNARSLSMTTEALRERLGQFVYSVQGWN